MHFFHFLGAIAVFQFRKTINGATYAIYASQFHHFVPGNQHGGGIQEHKLGDGVLCAWTPSIPKEVNVALVCVNLGWTVSLSVVCRKSTWWWHTRT